MNGNVELKDLYDQIKEVSEKVIGIGSDVSNIRSDVSELKTDVKEVKSCLNEDRIKIGILESNTKTVEDIAKDKFDKLADIEREASKIKSLEDAIKNIKEDKDWLKDKAVYLIMTLLSVGTAIGIALFK